MNSDEFHRLNISLPGSDLSAYQSNDTLKRRAIQKIMYNKSISDFERRRKIQEIMSGSSQSSLSVTSRSLASGDSFPSKDAPLIPDHDLSCIHYQRRCNIVAPCCGRFFGCRLCHDQYKSHDHSSLNRFKIKYVVCKDCLTKQVTSNLCIKCGIQFGEYYCNICNLWMQQSKEPFHCNACGLCRTGGESNFKHCHECDMCISVSMYKNHNCMKEKYKRECPICRENLFQSRMPSQDLLCGHVIHSHCFRRLVKFDCRCPICKKTLVHPKYMANTWESLARDIQKQPMPEDLTKDVTIICCDCEKKSEKINWHFLGIQCPKCKSFNTVVES